jgi:hypothetical protein
MSKLFKLFFYPYQGAALWLNLVLTVVFSFVIWSAAVGVFALFTLPIPIILLPWFMKYCLITGEHSANGSEEQPVLGMSQLNPLEVKVISLVGILIGIAWGLNSLLGTLPMLLVMACISPSIVSAFILQDSTLKALNPLLWILFVWHLGFSYLAMVMVIVVVAIMLYLIPDGFLVLAKVSLVLAIFVGMFHAIGVIIYNNKDKLNIEVSENARERQKREQADEKERHFNGLVKDWYRLSRSERYREALDSVQSYLHGGNEKLEDYENVLLEFMQWQNPKMAAMYVPVMVEKMIMLRSSAKALKHFQAVWDRYGPIPLLSDTSMMKMALLARDTGRNDIAASLLRNIPPKFPNSSLLGQAEAELAKLTPG